MLNLVQIISCNLVLPPAFYVNSQRNSCLSATHI